jgi:hypothetical protein
MERVLEITDFARLVMMAQRRHAGFIAGLSTA